MHNEDWQTPDDLFQVLDEGGEYMGIHFDGFNFDIDLAATAENSKCNWFAVNYLTDRLSTKKDRFSENLQDHIKSKTCWLNPPYSRDLIKPFIEKAWSDSRHCKIVCLVKVDPSTEWWSTFWDYDVNRYVKESIGSKLVRHYNGPKPGCEVIYFPKRIKFDPPSDLGLTCYSCDGDKYVLGCKTSSLFCDEEQLPCLKCKGTGKRKLSGPSFPSCLIIMDRRNV